MIVAAAIMQNGCLFNGVPFKDRHHDIIHHIETTLNIRPVTGKQGFIDQDEKFYTRKEAAIHAIECGQVVKGRANIEHVFDGKRLYSEDLW
jgi:hypothetical protein